MKEARAELKKACKKLKPFEDATQNRRSGGNLFADPASGFSRVPARSGFRGPLV